jgi:hypothetical protein
VYNEAMAEDHKELSFILNNVELKRIMAREDVKNFQQYAKSKSVDEMSLQEEHVYINNLKTIVSNLNDYYSTESGKGERDFSFTAYDMFMGQGLAKKHRPVIRFKADESLDLMSEEFSSERAQPIIGLCFEKNFRKFGKEEKLFFLKDQRFESCIEIDLVKGEVISKSLKEAGESKLANNFAYGDSSLPTPAGLYKKDYTSKYGEKCLMLLAAKNFLINHPEIKVNDSKNGKVIERVEIKEESKTSLRR